MPKGKPLNFYVPGHPVQLVKASTSNLLPYLTRVASKYPENTLAVYHHGNGTHVYRKTYSGGWKFERQTIGPTS